MIIGAVSIGPGELLSSGATMADQQWPALDCAQLEDRGYGPTLTPAERELLSSQIYIYAPGIIRMTEAPILSPIQLDVYEEKLHGLAADLDKFQMLIDLSKVVNRPQAADRARLKEIFSPISSKVTMAAVFTGKNFILNMAAKFILGGLGFQSLTVHKHKAEALEALGYEP